MTTTITVRGAATITSILHNPDGDRETVEQTAEDATEDREASFPIHNTLSLRVEGAGAKVTVAASDWLVSVDQVSTGSQVERRSIAEFVVGEHPVTLRENTSAEPVPVPEA